MPFIYSILLLFGYINVLSVGQMLTKWFNSNQPNDLKETCSKRKTKPPSAYRSFWKCQVPGCHPDPLASILWVTDSNRYVDKDFFLFQVSNSRYRRKLANNPAASIIRWSAMAVTYFSHLCLINWTIIAVWDWLRSFLLTTCRKDSVVTWTLKQGKSSSRDTDSNENEQRF